MDEIDSLSTIEDHLLNGVYPPSFSKNEKCSLRRRCRNNFKLEDGILMYQSRNRNSTSEETWRICVRTVKEKIRVLRSCHAGMEGIIVSINYYQLAAAASILLYSRWPSW